jgi:hypothetical protein
MIERIDFTKLPTMISWYGFVKYFWDATINYYFCKHSQAAFFIPIPEDHLKTPPEMS